MSVARLAARASVVRRSVIPRSAGVLYAPPHWSRRLNSSTSFQAKDALSDATIPPRPKKVLDALSMAGKVCMVTGAARGLGNQFAKAFVDAGCSQLAILDLVKEDAHKAAQDMMNYASSDGKSDVTVIGLGCDVASELSVQAAYANILDKFGRIDSVVASAGIVENYEAMDYPFDRVKRLFDINVHGAFFTAREGARAMFRQGGGSIILVSSMSANIVNVPQPQTPYNASKAAVKHMAASLGVEWAKRGLSFDPVAFASNSPGYMLTKLTKTILDHDQELKKTWESLTPMGRMGDPEDLDGVVVFLASDASRFMTGTEIRVDGGYCCL
ncbi:NAD(P)-binding protein [Fistulina hepatica ATCC 64428]|uniref:NAD(P)-binding protein n=1 Tax=Fistulina hepatica ATCC 64428 TaxID=1128425 RepID=A0A0D6ZYR9_9AGAR|nr:NAD(P)-binding protein [Fistulina hepatica ATCC 64428]